MNTSGIIRGYMSKNMSEEEYINVVVKALSREFEEQVNLIEANDGFTITMGSYSVEMSRELIGRLKSPYRIDRYILEEFEKQEFDFNHNRSQYIQYCFGNYGGEK